MVAARPPSSAHLLELCCFLIPAVTRRVKIKPPGLAYRQDHPSLQLKDIQGKDTASCSDTGQRAWPTQLLNDCEGSRGQGLAVTVLAAASFSPVPPPPPFPAMSFAEEFSDRAFAAVHQRAGDLPANHQVLPPLRFSPSYPGPWS